MKFEADGLAIECKRDYNEGTTFAIYSHKPGVLTLDVEEFDLLVALIAAVQSYRDPWLG